jgi:hypothetical protein
MNLGDLEVESNVQVGSSTNSTDIEVRVTHTAAHTPTREESRRFLEVIRDYIASGTNTTWPLA